jgi:hypothetical protein
LPNRESARSGDAILGHSLAVEWTSSEIFIPARCLRVLGFEKIEIRVSFARDSDIKSARQRNRPATPAVGDQGGGAHD